MKLDGVITLLAAVSLGAVTLSLAGCSGGHQGDASPSIPQDWVLDEVTLNTHYEELVDGVQIAYGLTRPPNGELIAYVPVEEWASRQADCLSDSGFSARPNLQGGVTFGDVPEGQRSALKEAAASCEIQYPVDPRIQMQLPTTRAANQYSFLVDTQYSCVLGLGYSVSDPPSEQVWMESYYSGAATWDPFSEAASQMGPGDHQLNELYQSCPPISESVYPPLE